MATSATDTQPNPGGLRETPPPLLALGQGDGVLGLPGEEERRNARNNAHAQYGPQADNPKNHRRDRLPVPPVALERRGQYLVGTRWGRGVPVHAGSSVVTLRGHKTRQYSDPPGCRDHRGTTPSHARAFANGPYESGNAGTARRVDDRLGRMPHGLDALDIAAGHPRPWSDLLMRPASPLTEAEQLEVKKVARSLLQLLKQEKLVLDWRKEQRHASTAPFGSGLRRSPGPSSRGYWTPRHAVVITVFS
jgi:hypothetical protein